MLIFHQSVPLIFCPQFHPHLFFYNHTILADFEFIHLLAKFEFMNLLGRDMIDEMFR